MKGCNGLQIRVSFYPNLFGHGVTTLVCSFLGEERKIVARRVGRANSHERLGRGKHPRPWATDKFAQLWWFGLPSRAQRSSHPINTDGHDAIGTKPRGLLSLLTVGSARKSLLTFTLPECDPA